MTAKKPTKPYKPPSARKPARQPTPAHEWQCMWGCGFSAGDMNTVRGHEGGCAQNLANR